MNPTDNTELQLSRRQPTWNNIQPQDNFDIRRSMIQSLPGSTNKFMGQNLGLVCLLQAAQIERLCESLGEYQLKYRSIKKSELDRHSYEIQIMELAKQQPDDSLKEVKKLKDFINRQNIEMEELRKRGSFQSDISLKYEATLMQLDTLTTEYSELKSAHRATLQSLEQSKIQMTVLQSAKNKEIERMRQSGGSTEAHARLQQQMRSSEGEIRRYKEMVEHKNTQITELEKRIRRLENDEQQTNDNRLSVEAARELKGKTVLLGNEVERLNVVLKKSKNDMKDVSVRNSELVSQYEECRKQLQSRNEQYTGLQAAMHRMQLSLRTTQQKLEEKADSKQYVDKIKMLSEEITRLNAILQTKVDECKRLSQLSTRQEYSLRSIQVERREMEELRLRVHDFSRLQSQYETKINRLENSSSERQRIKELEMTLHTYEQSISSYETSMREYKQRVEEAEQRIQQHVSIESMYREVQRLNNVLRLKMAQTHALEEQAKDQDNTLRKYQQQYQEQYRSLKEQEDTLRRAQVEINRLNDALKTKVEELEYVKRNREDVSEYRSQAEGYRSQIEGYRSQIEGYRSQIETYKSQLDEMQRVRNDGGMQQQTALLRQKVVQYEREISEYKYQVESMRSEMSEWRSKHSDLERRHYDASQSEVAYKTALTTLQKQKQEAEIRISQLSQIINEYEVQHGSFSQDIRNENATLKSRIKSLELDIETERRKYEQESKARVSTYEQEYKARVSTYEQEYTRLKDENMRYNAELGRVREEQRKAVSKYEETAAVMSQQLSKYRSRAQEYTLLQQQHETAKQQLHQISSYAPKYESQITYLKQENQRLGAEVAKYDSQLTATLSRLTESESKHMYTSRAQAQLSASVTEYRADCERLKRECDSLRRGMEEGEEYKRRMAGEMERSKSSYEGAINKLTAENNEWKRKVSESSQQAMTTGQQLINSNQQLATLQYAMSMVEQENGKLAQELKMYGGESEKTRRTMAQYEQELKRSTEEGRRVSEELRKVAAERAEYGRRTNELEEKLRYEMEKSSNLSTSVESKLKKAYIEIERLNTVLSHLTEDNKALDSRNKGLLSELDEYRLRVRDFQEVNRRIGEYERRLTALDDQLRRRDESIKRSEQELKRRGEEIRKKGEECDRLSKACREMEGTMSEMAAITQKKQMEQVKRRSEMEVKLTSLTHQVERLNAVLKSKIDQHGSMTNQMRQRYESEQQEQQYSHQQTLKQCYSQIERLNNTLRLKMEETVQWEHVHNQMQGQLTHLLHQHESLLSAHNSSSEDSRKMKQILIEHRNSIGKVSEELERLKNILQQAKRENEGLRGENEQMKRVFNGVRSMMDKNTTMQKEMDKLEQAKRMNWGQMEDAVSKGDWQGDRCPEECMTMFVLLCAEVQALRSRVKDDKNHSPYRV